jgi:hypothetical protein
MESMNDDSEVESWWRGKGVSFIGDSIMMVVVEEVVAATDPEREIYVLKRTWRVCMMQMASTTDSRWERTWSH